MWGQSASVTCSINGLSGGTFILRHLNQEVQTLGSNPATFNLPQVTADNKGPYHCLYRMVLSGQTLDSPQSDSLLITVKFPKPSISVSPSRDVMWGQHGVSVTCTISTQISGGVFKLMHRHRDIQTSSSPTFYLPRVTFDSEGSYHCQYQRDTSGPVLTSPQSDSLTLQVSVDLPVPSLCVSSPAGGHCSSDTVHITRGDSFVLSCSVPSDVPEGLFLLWFSGSNSSVSEPSVNHSASFYFNVSQSQHQGQYSCVYQVTGAGRTYTSETVPVQIYTKLPLVLLVAPSVVGVVLILGLVSLLLFLVLKKRSQSQHSESTVQAQMNAVGNQYLEDSDEDEADYVNVDAPQCTKPVSDAPMRSNQYQYCTRFNAVREESTNQEDEDDDDDDDYENVTNTEEQDDIYQNF
ncbi:uncharacterized protein LOC129456431 [Periophthalmus magnuspinnatus]|uniref:uncharacterized protein LOC129456431 n=1 Tax=Periophthalmus magnuspinnatus TaxID=409849 RepID=UPI002436D331|nr:uncharacterized protein LOC129456431 [Periophthalmus magnuspinnatus]